MKKSLLPLALLVAAGVGLTVLRSPYKVWVFSCDSGVQAPCEGSWRINVNGQTECVIEEAGANDGIARCSIGAPEDTTPGEAVTNGSPVYILD